MATVNFNANQISDAEIKNVLRNLCDYFQANVEVTSGNRTSVPKGGSPDSLHLKFRAADFFVDGLDYGTIYLNLRNLGHGQVFVPGHGYEFIWHGVYTATSGEHLHIGRYGLSPVGYVKFKTEGLTPETKDVYETTYVPLNNKYPELLK